MKRPGFTFVEILVGLLFVGVTMFALLNLSRASAQGTMDAYQELIVLSLGREPIEVFKAFGYPWLAGYRAHPLADYPLETWMDVSDQPNLGFPLPAVVTQFRRRITMSEPQVVNDSRGIRIRVEIQPRGITWLSRPQVVFEALIMEKK